MEDMGQNKLAMGMMMLPGAAKLGLDVCLGLRSLCVGKASGHISLLELYQACLCRFLLPGQGLAWVVGSKLMKHQFLLCVVRYSSILGVNAFGAPA